MITLIITIGLLMIIAGVTIGVVLNENTINKSQQSTDDEKNKITDTQNDINKIIEEWNIIER